MSDWEIKSFDQSQPESSEWSFSAPNLPPKQEKFNPVESSRLLQQSKINPFLKFAGQLGSSPLFQVARDIKDVASNAISNIPSAIRKGSEEIPGAVGLEFTNPLEAFKNFTSGIPRIGNEFLNLPRGIAEYAEKLNILPQGAAKYIPQQGDISSNINQAFGLTETDQPGQSLLRELLPTVNKLSIGAKGLSPIINPLLKPITKYTDKNIANNIVKAKNAMISKYDNLYNNLWAEAKNNKLRFSTADAKNPKLLKDFKTINRYSTEKQIGGTIDSFNKSPNIITAHNLLSDMKYLRRSLENKKHLTDPEGRQYRALNRAINHVQNNLFKDAQGKIDKQMLEKYNTISKGYMEEAIPYRKEPSIELYEQRKMKARKLVPKLREGQFGAFMEDVHPELEGQLKAKKNLNRLYKLGSLGLGGTAIGAGFEKGKNIFSK